jgi:hypothetical protein
MFQIYDIDSNQLCCELQPMENDFVGALWLYPQPAMNSEYDNDYIQALHLIREHLYGMIHTQF